MAGAGYKLFNTGDVLTAAQVNTYLQEQVVMVFANAAARTTALSGVLAEGMVTYLKDTDALEIYSGTAWVGYGSGDITGITTGATSGLTGGVTSGTADLKFNTTAKGGLLVGTGSGTVSELTVGANNTVLTADSSTATGLKWAAASSTPSFVGCSVYKTSAQTITTATTTVISWDNEDWDTDTFHDNSTNNGRFTIPTGKGGKYLISAFLYLDHYLGSSVNFSVDIVKNGNLVWSLMAPFKTAYENQGVQASSVINLVAGDYVDLRIYQASGNNASINGGLYNSRAQIVYLGA